MRARVTFLVHSSLRVHDFCRFRKCRRIYIDIIFHLELPGCSGILVNCSGTSRPIWLKIGILVLEHPSSQFMQKTCSSVMLHISKGAVAYEIWPPQHIISIKYHIYMAKNKISMHSGTKHIPNTNKMRRNHKQQKLNRICVLLFFISNQLPAIFCHDIHRFMFNNCAFSNNIFALE